MRSLVHAVLGLATLSLAVAAAAQKPIAYPARGQSPEKQGKDDAECYSWTRQATGIDPATVGASMQPQQTGPAVGGGERMRGAARGAVGGAAIGAIAGDAGEGAGVGAVVGTMAGGRQARQNQAAANQQGQANVQASMN